MINHTGNTWVSQHQVTEQETAISDIEIMAGLFRLARRGRFVSLEMLLRAGEECYPEESPERIRACPKQLGKRQSGGLQERKLKAVVG